MKKLTFHPVVFTWHVRGWSSESFCWRHRRLYTLFHALLHTFGGRLMWIDEFGKGSAFHVNVEGEVGAGDVSQFVGHVLTRGTHQLPVFSQLFFCANYRTCQTTLTSEQQTRRHLVSWKQKKRHIKDRVGEYILRCGLPLWCRALKNLSPHYKNINPTSAQHNEQSCKLLSSASSDHRAWTS